MNFLQKSWFFVISSIFLFSACSSESLVSSSNPSSEISSMQQIVASRQETPPFSSEDTVSTSSSDVTKVSPDQIPLDSLSAESITWGVGKNQLDDGRPVTPVSLQEEYGHFGAYFISPAGNQIYLTFDEGYENGYTASILDTLKKQDVQAVFFVTLPYAKENPELIKRIIEEGHVLGNHSVSHLDMTTLDTETATEEILGLHKYIEETYSYTMWLFRPPTGTFSEKSLAIAHNAGYISVFWSFAYRDWLVDDQMDPPIALDQTTNLLHQGAIYLLHAVSATNTAILEDFILNSENRGYTFASFEELEDPYQKI